MRTSKVYDYVSNVLVSNLETPVVCVRRIRDITDEKLSENIRLEFRFFFFSGKLKRVIV